ncbi:hypothetical protein [Allokutzneria oryzae]|uniref:Condensation domain-containing protein n=1 Tax=Allokutzneria oryzae TaxID=1378989 RepID=A0ABV5ZTR8_9PSEU
MLFGELFRLYEGDPALSGTAPGFTALPSWLNRQDHDAAAQTWAELLDGAKPTLFAAPIAEELGHPHLFAAHVVFHNYPLDTSAMTRMGEVAVRRIDVHDGTHYPLSLVARVDGARLELRVDYRPDAFTEAEAHEVGECLLHNLRALAANATS